MLDRRGCRTSDGEYEEYVLLQSGEENHVGVYWAYFSWLDTPSIHNTWGRSNLKIVCRFTVDYGRVLPRYICLLYTRRLWEPRLK